MSTTTRSTDSDRPADEYAEPIVASGPFLVGTDTSLQSDAALHVAHRLSQHTGAAVELMSVIDPLPVIGPEVQIPFSDEVMAEQRASQLSRAHDQLQKLLGSDTAWPLTLGEGQPASVIAGRAHAMHVRLIIVGLGRHGMLERLFGDETALQLLRLSAVPVLAVAPGCSGNPQHVVVAMDFSPASIRAAQVAMELVHGAATLYLVHVVSRRMRTGAGTAWEAAYTTALEPNFARVQQMLNIPSSVTVERVILHGDPASELLHFADRVHAELIAAGTHGHDFLSRMLLGSVTTKLVRASHCSMLAVPMQSLVAMGEEHEGTGG